VRDRALDLITIFLRGQQTVLEELNQIGVSEEEFALVYALVAKNVKTLKLNIKVVSLTLKRLNAMRDQIQFITNTLIEPLVQITLTQNPLVQQP
jgi:hypothetical protein